MTRLGLKLARKWPPMAEQLRMSVGPAGSIETLYSTETMLFEITVGPRDTDFMVYAQARPSGVETEVECRDISQVMTEIAKLRAA